MDISVDSWVYCVLMSEAWQWERPDTLGSRIRFLRESFRLSARAAAIACGVGDDQTWRNWERGTHTPSADKVKKIAERFEGRTEDHVNRLAAWLAFGGALPPAPRPRSPFSLTVTLSDSDAPKRPGKSRTRRNSVYNSAGSLTAVA